MGRFTVGSRIPNGFHESLRIFTNDMTAVNQRITLSKINA